jgi:hypothetical protein
MTGPFIRCARAKATVDALSPEWRAAWEETYEAHFGAARERMSEEAADMAAGSATVKRLQHLVNEQKRRLALQATARARILAEAESFKATDVLNPNAQMAAFMKRLMENMGGRAGKAGASVQGRYKATVGRFHAMMAGLIEDFEAGVDANLVAPRNRALLGNVVREAFGETTGDAKAAQLAKAWAETAEYARQSFNAAGGDIAKLARWGLPQAHDGFAIRRAAGAGEKDPAVHRRAWIDFVRPLIDPDVMIDQATGLPIAPARLELALQRMFDNIVSDGQARLAPGQEPGGSSALARQHQDHRFLVFKDAASWTAYQERFGTADPFNAMMGHLDMMARDIAAVEVLGPDPRRQWDWLELEATRQAGVDVTQKAGARDAGARGERMLKQARHMFETYLGSYNAASGENRLAGTMAGVRGYLTTAQLGSSVLMDVPSAPVFGAMARAIAGLDRAGDVSRLVKLLNPADDGHRAIARRIGIVNEGARDGLVQALYHAESINGGAIGSQLPSAMLRLIGQTAFTNARQRSFAMEFLGALGDATRHSFSDLQTGDEISPALARSLQRWGISAKDWDKIREVPLDEVEPGAAFLDLSGIEAAHGRDLAMRVSEMVQQEMVRAVPVGTLYSRAALIGGTQAGSVWGEIVRSVGMYRGFIVTLGYTYGQEVRAKIIQDGIGSAALAATAATLGLTLAASVGMQAREVAKGNEPRAMDTSDFWSAALLQSGGLGILGDFFTATQSRAGSSASLAGLGPVGGLGADVMGVVNDGMAEVGLPSFATSENPNPQRKAANLAARYAPWSSIWWARAAWDRTVIAGLRYATDEDAEDYYSRMASRLEKQGQGMWWAPGAAPDVGELLDGTPNLEPAGAE